MELTVENARKIKDYLEIMGEDIKKAKIKFFDHNDLLQNLIVTRTALRKIRK